MIDGAAGRPSPERLEITTVETLTITLSRHPFKFDKEHYNLDYDPALWVRLVDGKEVPFESAIGPYPDGGWVLRPRQSGPVVVRLWIYQDDPSVCTGCVSEHSYTRSYNFDVHLL